MLKIRRAKRDEYMMLHQIQVTSFLPMLEKYRDHDTSPGAETPDRILERFDQPFTHYYFIESDHDPIGMLRVCDFGDTCHLAPICILPRHQGRGFASQAMRLAEANYPDAHTWTLDTIAQEEKLCHLYEKMGYRKTGKVKQLAPGMDLVYYAKTLISLP